MASTRRRPASPESAQMSGYLATEEMVALPQIDSEIILGEEEVSENDLVTSAQHIVLPSFFDQRDVDRMELPTVSPESIRGHGEYGCHSTSPWFTHSTGLALSPQVLEALPAIVRQAGPSASKRFVEFFLVTIHNPNTRAAYAHAVSRFLDWCDQRGLTLEQIEPLVVASYIQSQRSSPQTIKQHLAAIRMLFDHLVTGQVLPFNPAASVKGPKYVIKKGKTPVLTAKEARQLLDSIDCSTLIGLRDRALIGLMTYTFARVSAAIGTDVGDYFGTGRRTWIRLHEKGGKYHEVPLHHNADEYLHIYIDAAGIRDERRGPLFRTSRGRSKTLSQNRMHRVEVAAMIKRRAKAAGLAPDVCCHTFRATGITAYLENGGTIEKAQQIAAHESPRTTKLYDRTDDTLTLDEVERILI